MKIKIDSREIISWNLLWVGRGEVSKLENVPLFIQDLSVFRLHTRLSLEMKAVAIWNHHGVYSVSSFDIWNLSGMVEAHI